MTPREALADLLAKAEGWTDDERHEAIRIGTDWQSLLARQVAGEDVSAELAHVRAQAAAIAAEAQRTGSAVLAEWLTKVLVDVLVGVATR